MSTFLIKLIFLAAGTIFCLILYNVASKDTETQASAKKYRDKVRENTKARIRKLAAKAKVNEKG